MFSTFWTKIRSGICAIFPERNAKRQGKIAQTERKQVDKNCIKLYNIGRACMNCGDGSGGRSMTADPDHRFIYIP